MDIHVDIRGFLENHICICYGFYQGDDLLKFSGWCLPVWCFRIQRARTLARSQPNLLNIMDECNGVDSSLSSNEVVVDKLPNMATLRSALSNPNLLDDNNGDSNAKVSLISSCSFHYNSCTYNAQHSVFVQPLLRNGGVRKRNALIEQWENRIQQQN